MNRRTQLALAAINRVFYERHAAHFSATRGTAWPGWQRICDRLPRTTQASVVDVGCGNGRLGAFLKQQRPFGLEYRGFDESRQLLSVAERELGAWATFSELDLLDERVSDRLAQPADLVAVFGVLHHLPGSELRSLVVQDCLRVLRPGGLLALTRWRFAEQPRFKDRLLPWSVADKFDVDPAQLEPGDHLLAWGSSAASRYCHALNARELEHWSQLPEVTVVERFFADGASGDLNEYLVLQKR